ncbi:MAG: hypothetical protein QOI07_336 [Verrucomicrobiota bacterium]|jgi:PAS domain-containing protein
MRALTAAEVLDASERGGPQFPAQRALTLLGLADEEALGRELSQLSVGERDAKLLALREGMFGRQLSGLTNCPACVEQLEFEIEAAALNLDVRTPGGPITLSQSEYAIDLRLPMSGDLVALDPALGLEGNRRWLLDRCVLRARRNDLEIECSELPDDVQSSVARRLAEADPQADLHLALTCPKCQHSWRTAFDIVSFLWAEIENSAGKLLREVHALAAAYGWPESEVLALTASRRKAYLELIEA